MLQQPVQNPFQHIAAGGFAGMVPAGEDHPAAAAAEGHKRHQPSLPGRAERLHRQPPACGEGQKTVRVIEHTVGKVNPVFVGAEGVGKGVPLRPRPQPVPCFQIMAHRRAVIAQPRRRKAEVQRLSGCPLRAERPVKPRIGRIGVPLLVIQQIRPAFPAEKADIAAGKMGVQFHDGFLRLHFSLMITRIPAAVYRALCTE